MGTPMEETQSGSKTPRVDPFELVSKARRDFYSVSQQAGQEPSPWIEECLGEFEHIQRAALGSRLPVGADLASGR